jgi:cellulose synthase/poly-beta-1,6-N-acetylglucosamine synthase-like glycosyltransferase
MITEENNLPLIDIVVAVYNGQEYIMRCLDALYVSDYKNKRIIFVNDGSTDKTADILKQAQEKYPSLIVLSKDNGGVSSARNFAVDFSNAEYIATTDVDCRVEKNWLCEALQHFKDVRTAAVTGWLHYDVDNILSAVRESEYFIRFKNRMPSAKSVSCPVCLFKRDVLTEIGGFEVFYKVGGEDTDIGYKIIKYGRQVIFEKNMTAYHKAENNLKLYIKRNFRNAYNHVLLMNHRKMKESFQDDFFPLILRIQPVLTLTFLFSIIFSIFFPVFAYFALICVILILYNFFPVIIKTAQLKGLKSFVPACFYLSIRNLVWAFGLLFAIFKKKIK